MPRVATIAVSNVIDVLESLNYKVGQILRRGDRCNRYGHTA